MGLKRNNPGCGCCGCPEVDCGDGTTSPIVQVTFSISGLPTDLVFWEKLGSNWARNTVFDYGTEVNGTHISTLNSNCLWDGVSTVALDWEQQFYSTDLNGCPDLAGILNTGTADLTISPGDEGHVIEFLYGGFGVFSLTFSPTTHNPCGVSSLQSNSINTSYTGPSCTLVGASWFGSATSST